MGEDSKIHASLRVRGVHFSSFLLSNLRSKVREILITAKSPFLERAKNKAKSLGQNVGFLLDSSMKPLQFFFPGCGVQGVGIGYLIL